MTDSTQAMTDSTHDLNRDELRVLLVLADPAPAWKWPEGLDGAVMAYRCLRLEEAGLIQETHSAARYTPTPRGIELLSSLGLPVFQESTIAHLWAKAGEYTDNRPLLSGGDDRPLLPGGPNGEQIRGEQIKQVQTWLTVWEQSGGHPTFPEDDKFQELETLYQNPEGYAAYGMRAQRIRYVIEAYKRAWGALADLDTVRIAWARADAQIPRVYASGRASPYTERLSFRELVVRAIASGGKDADSVQVLSELLGFDISAEIAKKGKQR